MMQQWRYVGVAVLSLVTYAGWAFAQCADGSSPPCRSQSVTATARRADPPLDDKTWIVVPSIVERVRKSRAAIASP